MHMKTLIAGVIAFASFTGAASAVTVDFKTLPNGEEVKWGSRISDEYAPVGVTFELVERGEKIGGGFAHRKDNRSLLVNIINPGKAIDANVSDEMIMNFFAPVDDLSFIHLDTNAGGKVTAYSASGTILESFIGDVAGARLLNFTSSDISKVVFTRGGKNSAISISDLSFTSPVPLPATAPLLIAALGFLGLRGRKAMAKS